MTAFASQERVECSRRFDIDVGHRLRGHESKCAHLHGHRYGIEAHFVAPTLDNIGRTVDFGVIKERLGAWLDAHWDHGLILCEEDKAIGDAICGALPFQRLYYLPYNPTAENMARYLLHDVCPALFKNEPYACVRVTVHETPNCSAVAAR
ncbi:MAG: 6-carboxytetrahydropterin synthase [Rickettsiales bacterium]